MGPRLMRQYHWMEIWRFDGGDSDADNLHLFADADGVFRAFTPSGKALGEWDSYDAASTWLSDDEYSLIEHRDIHGSHASQ